MTELRKDSVSQITIDDADAGQRIDNYLVRILKGVPKSHVYRILRSGEVRVNKGRIEASYRIQIGDVLRIPPVRIASREDGGRPVPAVRQCGSERSRQQNGDGDENTSAATRRPEHHVGEKWTTMGCAKRLGTVAVGRDRRITKLRAKRGGDGH